VLRSVGLSHARESTAEDGARASESPSSAEPAGAAATAVEEVYLMALRMLWHPADAEEATRQIFRSLLIEEPLRWDESLRLAILGVAARFLLSSKKTLFERQQWTFEDVELDLLRGCDQALPPEVIDADRRALEEEVKTGCSQTVLLCLDRPHRMAYLLGTLMQIEAPAAAAMLEIDVALYRSRFGRAEESIRSFMQENCGLVNAANPCRCSRRLGRAVLTGRVAPERLLFIRPFEPLEAFEQTREADHAAARPGRRPEDGFDARIGPSSPLLSPSDEGSGAAAAAVFRTQPLKPAPPALVDGITSLLGRASG
jgi:hypothetical protein